MKSISFSQIKLIGISALFFFITLFISKPQEKKRSEYIPLPLAIKNMTAGFNYSIADSLWLRAIQDFDYCEQKINEMECKSKSWLFQTLNLATEVDPPFESEMYRVGGLALSVIISDYEGAGIIFDKAVAQYPTSWEIAYTAAYHALYDRKDRVKAARLYDRAGRYGAPEWVSVLAGRLAADNGELAYSKRILEGMIAANKDEKIIKRLKDKIAELEAQQSNLKK